MAFDIKAQAEQIVEKIRKDPSLMKDFQKDPVKAVEKLAGIKLPDGAAEKLSTAVKAKLTADNVAGAASALGSLFGKK